MSISTRIDKLWYIPTFIIIYKFKMNELVLHIKHGKIWEQII